MKPMMRARWLALLGLLLPLAGQAAFEEEEEKPWQEIEAQLPQATRQQDWVNFYVSAVAENRFYVDGASLSVDSDGVVRYVLIVVSPEGARNVSYEGMRCETAERRIYASGRSDGSWSKSRNNAWTRIRNATVNRQYATLFAEYFCPGGVIVRNAAEALSALKRGGHPSLTSGR